VPVLFGKLLCPLIFSKHSVAGEIVDTEWYMNKLLTITYSPASGIVTCTAYNSEGKAIGGGEAYSVGGVARVIMHLPFKYGGKKLKVKCK
jgi:hypothetical protein